MATTTNYSWTTPDDTALVKDGASAIRTLGSSADTTVKALNPGTTAGDIDYYTTSTAKARIGIGTAGQVLQVNSGATAPEWATASSGGMDLISTTSLSGASVTLSSIPATYKNLQLVIRDVLSATDNVGFSMRLNGDSTASRYATSSWGAAANAAISFDQDKFPSVPEFISNSVTENMAIYNFYDYTNTVSYKYGTFQGVSVYAANTAQITRGAFHLFYNQTAAISSITLLMSSGNITSGTALLYGVK